MKVSFPPKRVKVKVKVEPEWATEGNQAVLKLIQANTEILWWHNGEHIHGSDSQTKVGSDTSSFLQIYVTEAHINTECKCEARHAATSKSVSNTTKIGVQCEYSECQFIHENFFHFHLQINHNSLMYLKKST